MQQKSTNASMLLLPSDGRGVLLCVLRRDSKQHQPTSIPSLSSESRLRGACLC